MIDDRLSVVAAHGTEAANGKVLDHHVRSGGGKRVLVFQASVEHGAGTADKVVTLGRNDLPVRVAAERMRSAGKPVRGVRDRR